MNGCERCLGWITGSSWQQIEWRKKEGGGGEVNLIPVGEYPGGAGPIKGATETWEAPQRRVTEAMGGREILRRCTQRERRPPRTKL